MRYKFRGKATSDGLWEYGSLWIESGKYYINGTDNNWWEVIPDTVGQFTGLKDKNGKEIYDGDIVEKKHCYFQDKYYRWRGVIKKEYSNNMYLFLTLKNFDGDFINGVENVDEGKWYSCSGRNDVSFIGGNFEMVGNIHENPELLEGVEQ